MIRVSGTYTVKPDARQRSAQAGSAHNLMIKPALFPSTFSASRRGCVKSEIDEDIGPTEDNTTIHNLNLHVWHVMQTTSYTPK